MSFGSVKPGLKNLLPQTNTWESTNTFRSDSLATTTTENIKQVNESAATVSTTIQVSPAQKWQGSAWDTTSSVARTVEARTLLYPASGNTTATTGILRTEFQKSSAGFSTAIEIYGIDPSGNTGSRLNVYGSTLTQNNHSNFDVYTSAAHTYYNVAGQYTNVAFKYGATIKAATTVDSTGNVYNRAAAGHNWTVGTIGPDSLVAYLYSTGLYVYQRGNFGAQLAAGSSDANQTTTLTSGGSFGVKGNLVTSATYTITSSQTVTYVDASNSNLCSGTATACSTYTNSGTCGTHSGVGCSWFSGNACSAFNSTDLTTCESGHSGCTFESTTCSGANNTDSITCESQDDSYGGSCAWNTSTCPSQTTTAACNAITGCAATEGNSCSGFTDTASCNGQTPCSATVDGDCTAFSDGGGDGTACATQPECSYDSGSGVCSGTYFTACVGSYFSSCDGNICDGSYYTGTCSGTYGALCQGTADCNLLTSSGTCAAESGCTWSTGSTITLPISTNDANRGNIARLVYIKRIGASGTVTVVANTGDTLESSISLTSQYQSVTLHHHNVISDCATIGSQSPCEAASGCTWNVAVVCSDYNSNESGCLSAGCSYSDPNCTGAGVPANCSGSYTSAKKWFKLATT